MASAITPSAQPEGDAPAAPAAASPPLVVVFSPPLLNSSSFRHRRSRGSSIHQRYQPNAFVAAELQVVAHEIADQQVLLEEGHELSSYYTSMHKSCLQEFREQLPSPSLARMRQQGGLVAAAVVESPQFTSSEEVRTPKQLCLRRVNYRSLLQQQQEECRRIDTQHQKYARLVHQVEQDRCELASRLESILHAPNAPHQQPQQRLVECPSPSSSSLSGSVSADEFDSSMPTPTRRVGGGGGGGGRVFHRLFEVALGGEPRPRSAPVKKTSSITTTTATTTPRKAASFSSDIATPAAQPSLGGIVAAAEASTNPPRARSATASKPPLAPSHAHSNPQNRSAEATPSPSVGPPSPSLRETKHGEDSLSAKAGEGAGAASTPPPTALPTPSSHQQEVKDPAVPEAPTTTTTTTTTTTQKVPQPAEPKRDKPAEENSTRHHASHHENQASVTSSQALDNSKQPQNGNAPTSASTETVVAPPPPPHLVHSSSSNNPTKAWEEILAPTPTAPTSGGDGEEEVSCEEGAQRVVVASCASLGIPAARAHVYVRKLEQNLFFSLDDLRGITTEEWALMGVPLKLVRRIRANLNSWNQ